MLYEEPNAIAIAILAYNIGKAEPILYNNKFHPRDKREAAEKLLKVLKAFRSSFPELIALGRLANYPNIEELGFDSLDIEKLERKCYDTLGF